MNGKMQIFDHQGNRLYLNGEEHEGPLLAAIDPSLIGYCRQDEVWATTDQCTALSVPKNYKKFWSSESQAVS